MPPRVERGAISAAIGIDTVVDRALRERIISAVDRAVLVTPGSGTRRKRGEVGDAFTLPAKNIELMVRRAIATDQSRVTWVYAGNEALVHLDKTRVAVAEGFVFVGLTLETDQTGPQELTTVFAVGTGDAPAGLLAVAEDRPRGDPDLAATFADAVVATAWRALLVVIATAAAASGRDVADDPLVPVALSATADGLTIVPQADLRLGQRR